MLKTTKLDLFDNPVGYLTVFAVSRRRNPLELRMGCETCVF